MTGEAQEVIEEVSSFNDITDLFDDSEESEEVEAQAETEEKTETTEEKGAEEEVKPEEVKAEETETETEVETPSTEQQTGQMAALIAERRKRQEAENKLKQYEKETVPDPIDDPEGYSAHIDGKTDKTLLQSRIDLSRDMMIELRPDFIEKEKVFMGMVANDDGTIKDQSLLEQFQQAANPAKFTLEKAEEFLNVQKFNDPNYEASLKEQLKAEILKELEAEMSDTKLKATEVPDLTTATADGKNGQEVVKDEDLDDIFKDSVF